MTKDRQHIERDIEHVRRNSINYEHNKIIFKCRMSYFRNYLNLEIVWHTFCFSKNRQDTFTCQFPL